MESELKLTRFVGLGGSEYTFTWTLPFCDACAPSASRTPVGPLHFVLLAGIATGALFLGSTLLQSALETYLFGGWDLLVSAIAASAGVAAYQRSRSPKGAQTSYYQPVRIRKLRQKFTSGEVTGMVLGFTSDLYARRFREANPGICA